MRCLKKDGMNYMATTKDVIYLLIIFVLILGMYIQYANYREDSFSRITKCFADEVKEVEWCEKFYDKYREK